MASVAFGVAGLLGTTRSLPLTDRELVLAAGVAVGLLYLVATSIRGGPSRDRKGRFRSTRRGQFLGLIKIWVLLGALWLGASLAGLL